MVLITTTNLGFPRVGLHRELKRSCEDYWKGKVKQRELLRVAEAVEEEGWEIQKRAGIDLVPINDFSLYDQVLDMVLLLGCVPDRYSKLRESVKLAAEAEVDKVCDVTTTAGCNNELDLYFSMARGYQKNEWDLTAMEMTKWFDTNYHFIVPEFEAEQQFQLLSTSRVFSTFQRAKSFFSSTTATAASCSSKPGSTSNSKQIKPVFIGPVSFLLLGKEKGLVPFDRLDLLDRLINVYVQLLQKLSEMGAEWVQLDEPCLVTDLSQKAQLCFQKAYQTIADSVPNMRTFIATYFADIEASSNASLAVNLPVSALHVDLVRSPQQLELILKLLVERKKNSSLETDKVTAPATRAGPAAAIRRTAPILSLGIVDGRNVWKNEYRKSMEMIKKAIDAVGVENVMLSTSCSLLHVPYDLDLETQIPLEIKSWMAFAKQKLCEVSTLAQLANSRAVQTSLGTAEATGTGGEAAGTGEGATALLAENSRLFEARRCSKLVVIDQVHERVSRITDADCRRTSAFSHRQKLQQKRFNLPLFPTTTIGSFPQTAHIRQLRADLKADRITQVQYEVEIEKEITKVIRWQEEIGLDVLVHGEFERNDMVEYFCDFLEGFTFTINGWVTSYGSRCVKPPIIYGDVQRKKEMTVRWSSFAQSQTDKVMKGILTGPVTIMLWSFVRDDRPRQETATQLALAIRDEVLSLEAAGLRIIQIDEPALREGLPLQQAQWPAYLKWAVQVFKLASSGVRDETQIHSHMCYSQFNDIIDSIADLDADVITIENSRSQMELLQAFSTFCYPNEIGPGVYDVHSQRVPSVTEIYKLLKEACRLIPHKHLWVNPDCGLKTRAWKETSEALKNLVEAARKTRAEFNDEKGAATPALVG